MTPLGCLADTGVEQTSHVKTVTQSDAVSTNRQLVARYLDSLRAHRSSPETIRTARHILMGLGERRGRRLEDLTRDDIAAWQSERSRELGERTLRSQVAYIRGFYRWAAAERLVEIDPTAGIRPPRVPMLLPRPVPEERLERALEDGDPRMRAILALAAFAGLRACEVARLVWGDIYLDAPEPYLRVVGKGNREGIVDVSPDLVDILRDLPNAHGRGPVIRRLDGEPGHNTANRISSIANRYLHEEGVPDTYHSLRHRFVTQVCRVGGLRQAQEAARHASATTTAGYAAVARRDLRPVVVQIGRIIAS